MLYILTEQIMNGTVTIDTLITGVESTTFQQAIQKIKNLTNFNSMEILDETDEKFTYKNFSTGLTLFGELKNKSLKIL